MASRFWVNTAGGTWDNATTANWSATSGGASGASVPGVSDTATFDNNSGSATITTNYNVSLTTLTLDATNLFAGTLALGGTLSVSATTTIGSGTFNTNGFTWASNVISSSNSNTRAINMTNSTINLNATTGTIWTTSTVTGLTLTATGSTLNITDAGASNKTLNFGSNLTLGNVTITSGGAGVIIFNPSTGGTTTSFSTLTCNGAKTFQLRSGTVTYAINSLVLNGSAGNVVTINSDVSGTVANVSLATTGTATYTTFRDINANARASINANDGHCINTSNNHNVIFATPNRLASLGVG